LCGINQTDGFIGQVMPVARLNRSYQTADVMSQVQSDAFQPEASEIDSLFRESLKLDTSFTWNRWSKVFADSVQLSLHILIFQFRDDRMEYRRMFLCVMGWGYNYTDSGIKGGGFFFRRNEIRCRRRCCGGRRTRRKGKVIYFYTALSGLGF
jgi:hypothetical protein